MAKTSQTLESILLSAQRLADEAVENANAKAETIVKEAQEKASPDCGRRPERARDPQRRAGVHA